MSTETDQFTLWRQALSGSPIDFPKDQPPSGFWKNGKEVAAIWRDDSGIIRAKRGEKDIDGDGAYIGESLAAFFRYPIPYEVYRDFRDGKGWPPEYDTRLSLKELQSGVMWTPELGRKKLGADAAPAAENPRAVIGGNNPPDDCRALASEIDALESGFEFWLKEIGGNPRNKDDADALANYAVKFGDMRSLAEAQHKAEKEPYLKAGRAVDAKWFPLRDKADALRRRILAIADRWIKAERDRRAEEARRANEAAALAGDDGLQDSKPETVRIGTMRTVSQRKRAIWRVVNLKEFVAYLAAMDSPPPDLIEACEKIARRMGPAMKQIGKPIPGIEEEIEEKAA